MKKKKSKQIDRFKSGDLGVKYEYKEPHGQPKRFPNKELKTLLGKDLNETHE